MIKDTTIILGLFLGLMASFATIANGYGAYQCNNYAKITGKETRWAMFDACYIKTKQGFQRYDEYKMRAITNE